MFGRWKSAKTPQAATQEPVTSAHADIEAHHLASVYPMLSGKKLDALCEAIQRDGQIEPILLYNGKILDGRNRYAACRRLGIEPNFAIFEGSHAEAAQFVHSLNSTRRHLTPNERAVAAVRLSQLSNLPIKDAAVKQGVSPASVKRAKVILASGDAALIKAVDDGTISLRAAYAQVKAASAPLADPETEMRRFLAELREFLAECPDLSSEALKDLSKLGREMLAAAARPAPNLRVVK